MRTYRHTSARALEERSAALATPLSHSHAPDNRRSERAPTDVENMPDKHILRMYAGSKFGENLPPAKEKEKRT
jgi:hypothetical protein